MDKKICVERRDEGDYAIRRGDAERASDVRDTQAEAIERAYDFGDTVLVERVRMTNRGKRDKWRKP